MPIRRFRGRDVVARDASPVRRRLFCFPYAGAGGTVFRSWPDHLPSDVEICIPCLPGRDARIAEAPASEMAPLVASLAREMRDMLDVPYALFGHSMGAFIAFDLAHELTRQNQPPAHLFVSAQRGPRLPYAGRPIFALPEDEFLAGILARYDSIPKQILEHQEFMAVLLRTLRADFTLAEDYRYRAMDLLTCPVTAFGGVADPHIRHEQLEAWALESAGPFRLHVLPGGHFFINDAPAETLSIVREQLATATRCHG